MGEFSAQANEYRTFRPTYPDELYEFLYQHTPGFNLALDCGTGTGQVASTLVERFSKVVATDISQKQIDKALPHERITYKVAEAAESGLTPDFVDLITVAQALHWFNTDKFYREANRVLKPGGLLACWGYGLCTINEQLDPQIRSFYDDVIGPFWPRQRIHIEQKYDSLRFPYPLIKAPEIEMQKQWNLNELLGYLRSWSSTQRYMQYKGYDPVKTLAVRLKRYWGDAGNKKTISWPLFIKAGLKS